MSGFRANLTWISLAAPRVRSQNKHLSTKARFGGFGGGCGGCRRSRRTCTRRRNKDWPLGYWCAGGEERALATVKHGDVGSWRARRRLEPTQPGQQTNEPDRQTDQIQAKPDQRPQANRRREWKDEWAGGHPIHFASSQDETGNICCASRKRKLLLRHHRGFSSLFSFCGSPPSLLGLWGVTRVMRSARQLLQQVVVVSKFPEVCIPQKGISYLERRWMDLCLI